MKIRLFTICGIGLLSALFCAFASEVEDGIIYEYENGAWWVIGAEQGVTDIVIPQYLWGDPEDKVGGIKQFAFWKSHIETVEVNVPQIQAYAFMSSHDLKEVTIGTNVKHIDPGAFLDCINLETLNISNGLIDIGDASFASTALQEIIIPKSVTSIGLAPFADCSKLVSISVDPSNSVFDSRDDCNAIITTSTNTLHTGCNSTIIPNSVIAIASNAFHMSGLTSINIPNSVIKIGQKAFQSCKSLEDVYIGESVKTLEAAAFQGCTALNVLYFNAISCDDFVGEIDNPFTNAYGTESLNHSIIFGEKVQRIPAFFAINNTNIRKLTIPNSVKTIGKKAFSGCIQLNDVTLGRSVNEIMECAFEGCPYINITSMNPIPPICDGMDVFHPNVYKYYQNIENILYVPKGCFPNYYSAPVWYLWRVIREKDFSAIYSDVNNDGEINIADINTVIDCILKGNQVTTSDVNCDGEVNIADINVIIDCILKG